MASGAWLCGMPQVEGMKEEDIADAEAVANADKLVNKITGGKALVLDALIQKLIKVNEILLKGVNKRSHKKYSFNKLIQVSNKIMNLYEKREAAAASGDAAKPAQTEEQKAEEAAKKEAEDKQKKIDEEEKKKKEEEEKKIAEEKKKREEEEKKRLEEEKKLVDEYKKEVDDLVTKVGAELDTAIGK